MHQQLQRQAVNYTQIANCVVNDSALSAKAKGLFLYIYSKPVDWDFSINRISKDHKDGRDAVASGLRELESNDYLQRKRHGDGRVTYQLRYDKTVDFDELDTETAKSGKSSSGGSTPSGKSSSGLAKSGKSQSGKILMLKKKDTKGIDNSNELSREKRSSSDWKKQFEESSEGEKVNKAINWFSAVNESIDRVYGHKAQREATEWLLDNYTPEQIRHFVTELLPQLNGKQYFPTATTPNQLVKKLPKIRNYFEKQKDKKKSEKTEITGLNT